MFKGLGCFQNEYEILLKDNANPIAHAPRRVPYAIANKLKIKLEELEQNKIIEKANEYSEWVNFLVTVEKKDKNKSLRLCIDPAELNKNILNEHSLMPTFDEIASKLHDMKYFTVLDLKDGFWQVKLTKESQKLCTFATPFGNYRFLRMPFGIKTASNVFQRMNTQNFGDIQNTLLYIDDILVMGKTKKEHDLALKKVLDRARERNVKFNANKMQIAKEKVKYLGHFFSLNEIKADPERIEAIIKMERPTKKKDLQTFLGVVNFMRSFIPNISELTSPLRELIKKNAIFNWTELHTKVFDEIKDHITKSDILVPFDTTKEIVIQCDASQNGLGCCLLQESKPISFASRSLTYNEQNYSQIEKEMLSILFACKKFHFYTYGRKVKVTNDHKPLLGIMKKEIHRIPSSKLQRMRLKLLNYDISLEYAPGKTIQIADYLSRYMIQTGNSEEDKTITESVMSINVSDKRKSEIQLETENDIQLKLIKEFCMNGWPNNKSNCPDNIKNYYQIKNEITIEDDILFYNDRIIIPKTMRKLILEKLHAPHFGITKTKQRARESVYWPNINQDIENIITHCPVCQKLSHKNQKEPMIPHDIPLEPFKKLACDVLEYKATNYLVIIDFYTKWIELVKLKKKTANEINIELLRVFSKFGYPHIIIADNMPFGSYECTQFADKHDFKFITSSPHYSQSNGLAERAVQICKNILKKSVNEEQIIQSLMAYRTTPTKYMNYSPSQLLFNNNIRTDIPMHIKKFKPKLCINVQQQHENKQNKMKTYYDKNAKLRVGFELNQKVLFRNNSKWQLGQIIKILSMPRSYVIESDGRLYRRNSRDIKLYFEHPNNENIQANVCEQGVSMSPKITRSGKRY